MPEKLMLQKIQISFFTLVEMLLKRVLNHFFPPEIYQNVEIKINEYTKIAQW